VGSWSLNDPPASATPNRFSGPAAVVGLGIGARVGVGLFAVAGGVGAGDAATISCGRGAVGAGVGACVGVESILAAADVGDGDATLNCCRGAVTVGVGARVGVAPFAAAAGVGAADARRLGGELAAVTADPDVVPDVVPDVAAAVTVSAPTATPAGTICVVAKNPRGQIAVAAGPTVKAAPVAPVATAITAQTQASTTSRRPIAQPFPRRATPPCCIEATVRSPAASRVATTDRALWLVSTRPRELRGRPVR